MIFKSWMGHFLSCYSKAHLEFLDAIAFSYLNFELEIFAIFNMISIQSNTILKSTKIEVFVLKFLIKI